MDGSHRTHPALEQAVDALAESVTQLSWSDVPEPVRDRTLLVVFDTLGVMLAGAQTSEVRALAAEWPSGGGSAPLVGLGRSVSAESSCWINGYAVCCLELDEGSKFARGHPAAHVIPSAIAMGRGTSGVEWLEAILAGYEVAARFGKATRLHSGVHPHGTWGTVGAAATAGRLLSLSTEPMAAALDAASALPVAAHFDVAFAGNEARNLWVGASNVSGIAAARLAASGNGHRSGSAGGTFGQILGQLDPDALTPVEGQFEILHGYFKQHASCAYTHSAADAVAAIRDQGGPIATDRVETVGVETYQIAATLGATDWPTRLAAMFSVPYVVAVMALEGTFGPAASDRHHRENQAVRRLAGSVELHGTDEFEARLPNRRGARVTFRFRDGSTRSAEVVQPIGDSDHHPFGWSEVRRKLEGIIGPDRAERLEKIVRELPIGTTEPLLGELIEVQR